MAQRGALVVLALLVAVPSAAQNASARGDGPVFDVASIKPNTLGYIDLGGGLRLLSGQVRCRGVDAASSPSDPLPTLGAGGCGARNVTVKELINAAYRLRPGAPRTALADFITSGPAWAESAAFDVDARLGALGATTSEQLLVMLQNLLRDRFHLKFHRETREVTGLALVQAQGGHRLREAPPDESPSFTAAPVVKGQKMPAVTIANLLSQRLGKVVTDRTGLSGAYDFTLTWMPDPTELGPAQTVAPDAPSLTTALREQLGLRLQTEKGSQQVFVIDAVERPDPN